MVLLMITFQAPEVPRVMLQLVVSQPAERPPFPLAGGRVVIGRELGSDLLLDDSSVSRHHAEIVREGDVWTIRDLGSTNGVYVNDALVAQARLAAGDRLRLGVFELSVLEVAAAEPVAQAFSTRVAGLKRSPSSSCRASEEGKPSATRPELKCPTQIASISRASMPAWASASRAASFEMKRISTCLNSGASPQKPS